MDNKKFTVPDIDSISPYVPGEQPRDFDYIKLNTNESPYPPSPEVLKAISKITMQLYPDPTAKVLKSAIADYYNVGAENIFVSNGSDETLAFAFRAFITGKDVFYPDITYDFYRVFASLYNARGKTIPLDNNFNINISDYNEKNGVIIIANPNAPTSLYLTPNDIEKLVLQNKENLVIIDEAYIDFGGETAIPLTKKYKNLLIVQTFSKSRSLAGLRLGFAVGDVKLIEALEKVKYSFNPYNVNMAAQYMGTASIRDVSYFKQAVSTIIKTREAAKNKLALMGIKTLDSYTNFLFAKHPRISGKKLYEKLKEQNILVRHFDKPRIKNYIRITIGTDAEMDKLIQVLNTF